MSRLAHDLGKAEPVITIIDQGIRFDPEVCKLLKNVFIHLARNAMDHGLETPNQRVQAGKQKSHSILSSIHEMFVKSHTVTLNVPVISIQPSQAFYCLLGYYFHKFA